jgi:hypothetical protein
MKRLGLLLVVVMLGLFTLGCGETKKKTTTPPAGEKETPKAGAPAEPAAPAAPAKEEAKKP